jgi:MazG family protein
MVQDLRVRCPWDRLQTRETLRPYLVEEVMELDHALAENDPAAIREELSDMLLHLGWQLALAEELQEFTADDLADDLETKMRRRHPHLFDLGDAEPWERLKRRERGEHRGALDGLLRTLPDLLYAYRLQERGATVGFDWPDVDGPIAKVREELEETERELAMGGSVAGSGDRGGPSDQLIDEVGDLLFAVVNLARKAGVQPGIALGRANRKFRARFEAVERLAHEREIKIETAGLEMLDRLWNEVKQQA